MKFCLTTETSQPLIAIPLFLSGERSSRSMTLSWPASKYTNSEAPRTNSSDFQDEGTYSLMPATLHLCENPRAE